MRMKTFIMKIAFALVIASVFYYAADYFTIHHWNNNESLIVRVIEAGPESVIPPENEQEESYEMLERKTVIQVLFAIAWGFIFTTVYLKSGSLLPCIIAHGLVDAFSKFSTESITVEWVYMIATIIIAVVYCIYLSILPNKAIETK